MSSLNKVVGFQYGDVVRIKNPGVLFDVMSRRSTADFGALHNRFILKRKASIPPSYGHAQDHSHQIEWGLLSEAGPIWLVLNPGEEFEAFELLHE